MSHMGNIRVAIVKGTVKNHVSHILSKPGARDRAHAAGLAATRGLVNDDEP